MKISKFIFLILLVTFSTHLSASYLKPNKVHTDSMNTDSSSLIRLALLGEVWGFLKYHHPISIYGKIDFDSQLIDLLKLVKNIKDDSTFSKVMDDWSDRLGTIKVSRKCSVEINNTIENQVGYARIFSNKILSAKFINYLNKARQNSCANKKYYVSLNPAKNPSFDHENSYSGQSYPNVYLRLLGLFRYWNIIQYFSPNLGLVKDQWPTILNQYIPKLVQVSNKTEYSICVAKLICEVKDTHAIIGSNLYNKWLGTRILPYDTRFIEGKLVIIRRYEELSENLSKLNTGDVILTINNINIDDLIEKYHPLISASNYPTALRDLPLYHILRTNNEKFELEILRGNQKIKVFQNTIPYLIKYHIQRFNPNVGKKGFGIIADKYGFIRGDLFRKKEYKSIRKSLKNIKGLIIDLRCYPKEEMIPTLVNDLKPRSSPFAKLTNPVIAYPGSFQSELKYCGGRGKLSHDNRKIIVLVNEYTQSHGEYLAMAFATVPNTRILGSTTAGADGNISLINFPGGIYTYISGLGVYYVDGTNTQQSGIKIDIPANPTINGVLLEKDELLEKAIEILSSDRMN